MHYSIAPTFSNSFPLKGAKIMVPIHKKHVYRILELGQKYNAKISHNGLDSVLVFTCFCQHDPGPFVVECPPLEGGL